MDPKSRCGRPQHLHSVSLASTQTEIHQTRRWIQLCCSRILYGPRSVISLVWYPPFVSPYVSHTINDVIVIIWTPSCENFFQDVHNSRVQLFMIVETWCHNHIENTHGRDRTTSRSSHRTTTTYFTLFYSFQICRMTRSHKSNVLVNKTE